MDFLKSIKKRFSKKRPTFYSQIQEEKQKKYLFNPHADEVFVPSRKVPKKFHLPQENSNSKVGKIFQKYFSTNDEKKDLKHIMMAVSFLLFFLVGYIIVISPYFRISPSKILVQPLTQGIDENIVHRSVENLYGKSIFLLDEQSIAHEIQQNLQNTEYIRIERLFPNGVKILIKSTHIQFDTTISGIENKRWGLSNNGVLVPISDIKNEDFSNHLELISDDLISELFLNYKKILSDKAMFLIDKIFSVFASDWSDLKIAQAKYFLAENELHIILESNTKIIFSLQEDFSQPKLEISSNLRNELLTLKTYIDSNREKLLDGSLTYLDIRIPGKVFVCASAAQCKQNLIDIYGKSYQ